MANEGPLRVSMYQQSNIDTPCDWWGVIRVELQQLHIDPLLSEPGSESTQTRKHHQKKGKSCTRPDQGYHQYATSQRATLSVEQGSGILERAGRTWPCLRSRYLSVFSKLVFCKQLRRWENFQPARLQGLNYKQLLLQLLVLLDLSDWSSSRNLIHLLLCSCLLVPRQVFSLESTFWRFFVLYILLIIT